jgi:hypothetical protein
MVVKELTWAVPSARSARGKFAALERSRSHLNFLGKPMRVHQRATRSIPAARYARRSSNFGLILGPLRGPMSSHGRHVTKAFHSNSVPNK